MKKLIASGAVALLALTACAQEAEDQVEDAYEDKADALEERAEDIRETADEKADALEDKADRMDALSDTMGDKVGDGALEQNEAMPANVVDNDENNIEEAAE